MSLRPPILLAAVALLQACAGPPREAGSEPSPRQERVMLLSQSASVVSPNQRVIECGYGSPKTPKLFQKRFLFWLGQNGGQTAPSGKGIGARFVPTVVGECPAHLLAAESLATDATSPPKASEHGSEPPGEIPEAAGKVATEFRASEYLTDIATARAQIAARRRPTVNVLNDFIAKYGPSIDALISDARSQVANIRSDPTSNSSTLNLFRSNYLPNLKAIEERFKLVDSIRQAHGLEPPEAVKLAQTRLTTMGNTAQAVVHSFEAVALRVAQRQEEAADKARDQEARQYSVDELIARMNNLSGSFGDVLKQSDQGRYSTIYHTEFSSYATALVDKLRAERERAQPSAERWREQRLLPALKALNRWVSLANTAHYNSEFSNSIQSNKIFAGLNAWDPYIGTGMGGSSATRVMVAWNALLAMARDGTGVGVSFPASLAQSVQPDGTGKPVGGANYDRSRGSSATYVIFATPAQLAAMAVSKGVTDAVGGAAQAMGDMTRIMGRLAAGVAQSRAAFWSCVQAGCKDLERRRAEFAAWLLEKDNTLLMLRVQPPAAGGDLAAILAGASSALLGTGPPDGGIHFACKESFDSVVRDARSEAPGSLDDHVKAMQRLGAAATRSSFLRYQSCRDEMEYLVRRP